MIIMWSGDYIPLSFGGAIYDSSKRRAETGDVSHDFQFVEFTDNFTSRARAERELDDRLEKLNTTHDL